MPACEGWALRIVADVTGEAEDRELERHLASCSGCRAEAKLLAGTVAAIRETRRVPEDLSLAGFASRVAERAERFRDRSPRGLWWTASRGTRYSLGVSLAAFVASVALVLVRPVRPVRPGPVTVRHHSAPLALRQAAPVRVTGTAGAGSSATNSAAGYQVTPDDIEGDMELLASPDDDGQDVSFDSAFAGLSNQDLKTFDQMLDNPS